MMNSDEPTDPGRAERSLIRVFIIAPFVTLSLSVGSLIATTSLVPRRPEGIRDVPDIEWSTLALIGNFVPLCLSLVVLSFVFRTGRDRIVAWLIAGFVCYVSHEMFVTDLLRRDFSGKF